MNGIHLRDVQKVLEISSLLCYNYHVILWLSNDRTVYKEDAI